MSWWTYIGGLLLSISIRHLAVPEQYRDETAWLAGTIFGVTMCEWLQFMKGESE